VASLAQGKRRSAQAAGQALRAKAPPKDNEKQATRLGGALGALWRMPGWLACLFAKLFAGVQMPLKRSSSSCGATEPMLNAITKLRKNETTLGF
jgi:hypothetical protein